MDGAREKDEMESAVTANTSKDAAPIGGQCLAPDLGHNLVSDLVVTKSGAEAPLKIRLPLKIAAFCFSVVTLSWFFEGTRQCKEVATLPGLTYLIGGIVLTLLLIALQAFFYLLRGTLQGCTHAQNSFV